MATGQDDDKWQKFVEAVFRAAGLPEIAEDQLEVGTYTNAQIAEKMRGSPRKLMDMLHGVSGFASNAEKRSVLSLAVDMANNEDSSTA